jgi:hypothetical protein
VSDYSGSLRDDRPLWCRGGRELFGSNVLELLGLHLLASAFFDEGIFLLKVWAGCLHSSSSTWYNVLAQAGCHVSYLAKESLLPLLSMPGYGGCFFNGMSLSVKMV